VRFTFDDLVAVMARLRGPEGCPWDREQTHASLAPYLLEETHEVLEAIARRDQEALRDELGDLLLQVVFHGQMAGEAGGFTAADVVDGLTRKLIDRHPHVFGDRRLGTPDEVLAQWHELKRRETPHRGVFEGIPSTLPSLARAQKILGRAMANGVAAQIPDEPLQAAAAVAERLHRAVASLHERERTPTAAEEAVGDLLLAAVALAITGGIDAEGSLRDAGAIR
jgi:tetrapyrrole methylase family protein/MazG family protein